MTARSPRQWRSEGFLPFRLEVLTPVHIGSGDALSPLEYVIREKNGKARLYRIDLQSWLMRHGSEQSVQNIIATGDISRIRRMLDEKVDETVYAVSSSPIPDLSLFRELRKAFDSSQEGASQTGKTGDVAAALRNPLDNSLYIPGSSLKGAMNTPLINCLDKLGHTSLKDAFLADPKRGMQDRLREMFGSISEHAMQALKVSDVAAPLSACAVVKAKEKSRNPQKSGTPKSPCEVIMPDCGDMWGRFLLDSPEGTPAITLPGGKTIPFAELVRLCNAFYSKRFTEEMKKFYSLPHFRDVHAALCETQKKVMGLGSDSMLLRVGHYSHVESVTVDKNQPSTRKIKGKAMPYGTTRTLADDKLPFGWVILHFCTQEEYETGMKEAEAARRAAVAEQTEQLRTLRQKAEEQAAQAALLKRQQEERRLAEAQKAAEEQKKREDLERRMAELPPEEARLLKLKTDPSEALSMEIFNEMKGWSPELQRKAAEALRDCWLALGKWNGKQSKKQELKIREVKALLA